MFDKSFFLGYEACKEILERRLTEQAPTRIQLLIGPRQVGKTTLLFEIEKHFKQKVFYIALDSPEATLPNFWSLFWFKMEEEATKGQIVVLLDEAYMLPSWSELLKAQWDRILRLKLPIHIVATGSSSLHLATDSRESLAGRFERLTLTHWTPSYLSKAFEISTQNAIDLFIQLGAYPGAFRYVEDFSRWKAYVRDAIIEAAIGRDIMSLAQVRKPALLRQIFALCSSLPAQIISLQKIVGQLQDAGAVETVSHYLSLLEEAFLVAALPKYSPKIIRMRASPPKIIVLSNALLAATAQTAPPDSKNNRELFGNWVENACIAIAWNAGQQVSYWREEPYEVDAIIDGSWGKWAIEIKTGHVTPTDLRGLMEFVQLHPAYRPLVLCDEAEIKNIKRMQITAIPWRDYLLKGLTFN